MKTDSARKLTFLLIAVAALTASAVRAQTTPPPVAETTLTASAEDTQYQSPVGFGTAVGIDGSTAAVGIDLYLTKDAQGYAPPPYGRVGIYSRGADGSWIRTASVAPNDPLSAEVRFGIALALKGPNLVIGSNLAVRIFNNSGGTWRQTATIEQPIGGATFAFDGHYLVINQYLPSGTISQSELVAYSVDANGTPSFVRNLPLPDGANTNTVAFGDGIVALQGYPDRTAQEVGAPVVFVYSSQSATPNVPQVLRGPVGSGFGQSISIVNQTTMVIGAPAEDTVDDPQAATFTNGAAHVYSLINGQWVHTQKVERSVPLAAFGTAIAANESGALISAPNSPDYYGTILGETEGYVWQDGQLVLVKRLTAEPGTSVAVSGNEAILGTNQLSGVYGYIEFATIVAPAPGAAH